MSRVRLMSLFILSFMFFTIFIGTAHSHYIQSHQKMLQISIETLRDNGYDPIADFLDSTAQNDARTYSTLLQEGARDADKRANGYYGIEEEVEFECCYDLTQNCNCTGNTYHPIYDMPDWFVGDHYYDPATKTGKNAAYVPPPGYEDWDPQEALLDVLKTNSPEGYNALIEETKRVLDLKEDEKLEKVEKELIKILKISNAADMAKHFYNQAKNEWNNFQNNNRLVDAMYNLGVAIHLIQDLTVPHHARPGNEPSNHGSYEAFVWSVLEDPDNWNEAITIEGDFKCLKPEEWVDKIAQITANPEFSTNPEVSGVESANLGIEFTTKVLICFFSEVGSIDPKVSCSVTRWDAKRFYNWSPDSDYLVFAASQAVILSPGCYEIESASVIEPNGTAHELACREVFDKYLFNNYDEIQEGKYEFVVTLGNGDTATCKDTYTSGSLPIPELVNWSNGDITNSLTPFIDWNDVVGAEQYWVRFWDEDRTTIIYDSRDHIGYITDETEHTIPAGYLEFNTRYLLEIIAQDKEIEHGSLLRIFLATLSDPILNPTNGHWYVLLTGDWHEVENAANVLGGHLVTINDQAEQNWLFDTFGKSTWYWIGFNDEQIEGNWVWSSGEAVTYTNWAIGEPNNTWPSGEHYAIINWGHDGEWNDVGLDSPEWAATTEGIVEFNSYPALD